MGGNAFKHLNLSRIEKCQIESMIEKIVETLDYPNFTYEYASNALMGSAGKKSSSGDLDFAINSRSAKFVGEIDLPVFRFKDFAKRVQTVLGNQHYNGKSFRGNQINTAWQIPGTENFVQVDFIYGEHDFLKFSHWSPGDNSKWAGVLISTVWGVLAKMRKDHEKICNGERTSRVGLRFDLEHGLRRAWQMQLMPGQGTSEVDPDFFETNNPDVPRFARINYITDPEAILNILFGADVKPDQVLTFEAVIDQAKLHLPERYEELCQRTVEAFLRSSGCLKHTREELCDFLNIQYVGFERDH